MRVGVEGRHALSSQHLLLAIREFDEGPFHGGCGDRHGLAGKNCIQCGGEIGTRRLLCRKGVVDRAVVGNGPGPGVDEERLSGSRDAERATHELQLIGEDRQRSRTQPAFELATLGAR